MSFTDSFGMTASGKTRQISEFAVTQIGSNPPIGNGKRINQQFKEEAQDVTSFLQGVHHSRKIAHQQVNYADTVSKLSKIQATVPVVLTKTDPAHITETNTKPMSKTTEIMTNNIKQYEETMSNRINEEHHWNYRKRLYNREVGRKAIVNEIMTGKGAMPKVELFAQKMTHSQCLALTGNLACPSPFNPVPDSAIARKSNKQWKGEGVGWVEVE